MSFCPYVRTLHPPHVRIVIVLDNFVPHLSTKTDTRVGEWAEANNVELAYTAALRQLAQSDEARAFLIRRYIAWRDGNAHDETLRELVKRANVACHAALARCRR